MPTRLPAGLEPLPKSGVETAVGAATQFGQGTVEGLASTLALPVDVIDAITRGQVSAALPAGLEPLPAGPSHGQRLATSFGVEPVPQTATGVERVARRTGFELGATAPITALAVVSGLQPAALVRLEALLTTSTGVGAGLAREATRSDDPLVDLAGQLVGAFGFIGAKGVIQMARRGAGAFTTGSRLRAERQVGRELSAAIPPGSQAEANLRAGAQMAEEVPGLRPTTAAVTRSPDVAAIEARAAARHPGMATQFAEREAANQAALQQQLGGMVPPGSVAEAQAGVGAALSVEREGIAREAARLSGIMDETAARFSKTVDDTVATLGTPMSNQRAGEVLIDALKTRENELRLHARELFAQVPDDRLPVKTLTAEIRNVTREGKQGLRPDVLPNSIRELDRKLSDAAKKAHRLREKMLEAGLPPDPSRIIGGGGEALLREPEVRFQQLAQWRSDLLHEYREVAGQAVPNEQAKRMLNKAVDAVEAALDQSPSPIYGEARAVYRDMVERFRQRTVADVLRRGPRGEAIRRPVEEIAGAFFASGKGAQTRAQDFVRAVGDNVEAQKALRDHALNQFFRTAYDADGVLNTKRAQAWVRNHQDALAAFPGVRSEVQQVIASKRRLDEAMEFTIGAKLQVEQIRNRSLADIDRSAAAVFTQADPSQAVRTILRGDKPGTNMRAIVQRAQGDEAAMRGLRRGLWDEFVAESLESGTGITGRHPLDPVRMGRFMEQNAEAFRTLYTPAEMAQLRRLQQITEMATTGNVPRGAVLNEQAPYTYNQVVGRIYGASRGFVSHGFIVAEGFVRKIDHTLRRIRESDLRAVFESALFDPKAAEALLLIGRAAPEVAASRVTRVARTLGKAHFLVGAGGPERFGTMDGPEAR